MINAMIRIPNAEASKVFDCYKDSKLYKGYSVTGYQSMSIIEGETEHFASFVQVANFP